MVIREGTFDVLVFGLLFLSPFLDRWLATFHRYLTGASTAGAWALFTYLGMWEICRRSPLRRYRTMESLATAAAASTVGLVFCLHRNNYPLALLVLSIGLMMGALMASIAVVATFLDWKLSPLEWVFTVVWIAAGGGVLAKGLLLDKTTSPDAAMIHGVTLVTVLLALLLIRHPVRLLPTLGLLSTLALALVCGGMASQAVLLGTKASVTWETGAIALVGFLAWQAIRSAWPTDASLPAEVAEARPSTVWAGPVGLIVYRVFETPPSPQPAQVETDQMVSALAGNADPQPALAPPEPSGESLIASATPVLSSPPRQPFGIIFPGRLAERLAVPAFVATVLYQLLH